MEHLFIQNPALKTILIVDDSVENLQLLSACLRDKYQIKIAKNGLKAMELLIQGVKIDLVLMDVEMPEMDGFEACKRIKSDPVLRMIPVIFLTALNDIVNESKGFDCGGSDFITKPFNPDIVLARIKTHLDIQELRKQSDQLLKNLLPDKVIDKLINGEEYLPEKRQNTSVLFCDLVGFTEISARISPEELLEELTTIFNHFDEIIQPLGIYRIKTIGDAYMACSGLIEEDDQHAHKLVLAGLQMIEFLKTRNERSANKWQCRIGVNSGEIIAGIVGKSRFQYDIMGDNVNIAARVESNGRVMKVTVTESTKNLLNEDVFDFESIGLVNLKGKGEFELFTVR